MLAFNGTFSTDRLHTVPLKNRSVVIKLTLINKLRNIICLEEHNLRELRDKEENKKYIAQEQTCN